MNRRVAVSSVLVGLLLSVVLAMSGCGGGGNRVASYTASERCAYNSLGQIAFSAWGGIPGIRYVYTMSERGGSVANLTPSHNDPRRADEGGYHPAFHPNGTLVAFTAKRPVVGEVASKDIYVVPTSGGESVSFLRLTTDPATDDQANWSPDGSLIVFMSDRNGDPDLWLMNSADGTNQHAVRAHARTAEQWPCFNPQNANQVAFQAGPPNGRTTNLFVLDLTTSAVTQITDSPYRNECPSWSPDGTRILFHSNRSGDFDIWSMAPDGTGLTQLTQDSHSDGYPVWRMGNGSRFVFTRDRQVWTALPDGTDLRQLTRTP
jgi:Tol biopolymer transport system component